jgi:glyoxylase-like metal-dependent hydrolase (beta-lactamase superfamily II)
MNRARVLTAIVAGGLAVAAVAAQQGGGGRGGGSRIPPTGAIEQVKENLYKIGGAGSNTTVFITADGVVLVDTKLANNGEAILKQVQTVTDKPVTMLINTHTHPDHNGSNDYFKTARPTIEVVAHENTKKWVAANPKANPAMAPDRVFTDKMTLGNGKDRIDLHYFGAGHTNGDAFVVFPSLRVMCVGDLMAWNMAPLIDPLTGGSVIALPDTLEKAVKGIKNVDLVIEGHGNVNTWQGFRAYAEFNRALLTAAKTALSRGQTPEQALAELEKNRKLAVFLKEELLKDLEYGGTPKSRALINLNVAFQELKGEPVTTNFGPPRGGGAPPPAPPSGAGSAPGAPPGK